MAAVVVAELQARKEEEDEEKSSGKKIDKLFDRFNYCNIWKG